MQLVLIHPNYHSGGAEIAGNWPPAWVAYLVFPTRQMVPSMPVVRPSCSNKSSGGSYADLSEVRCMRSMGFLSL